MPELRTLEPHEKDPGGGFTVRRSLPSVLRQSVGPFVFFDHFGPVTTQPGDKHDVRPHPHIGLATVTCLLEGAMMHRDSTGVVQRIEPGAINLMTAGRGIVHSERTPKDLLGVPRRSRGLQLWLALPAAHEEDRPGFQHVPGAEVPARDIGGVLVRVLIGGTPLGPTASSSGTSSPAAGSASCRRRTTRKRSVSSACPARPNSSRCRRGAPEMPTPRSLRSLRSEGAPPCVGTTRLQAR